jgi:hypothetical protein
MGRCAGVPSKPDSPRASLEGWAPGGAPPGVVGAAGHPGGRRATVGLGAVRCPETAVSRRRSPPGDPLSPPPFTYPPTSMWACARAGRVECTRAKSATRTLYAKCKKSTPTQEGAREGPLGAPGRRTRWGGRGARRAGGGVAGARAGYPTVAPTLQLHLPYSCTYPTVAPTLQLHLPYTCTYPTLAPTLHLHLPYTCTYPTLAPTLQLHLPYTCAPAHPGKRAWEGHEARQRGVPGKLPYTPVPTLHFMAGYPTPTRLPIRQRRARHAIPTVPSPQPPTQKEGKK